MAGEAERSCARRDPAQRSVVRGGKGLRGLADRGCMDAVLRDRTDDDRRAGRAVEGIRKFRRAERIGDARWRDDLLAGDVEREIEVARLDHVDLRAALPRSEERRDGKEWTRTVSSVWSPNHKKQK